MVPRRSLLAYYEPSRALFARCSGYMLIMASFVTHWHGYLSNDLDFGDSLYMAFQTARRRRSEPKTGIPIETIVASLCAYPPYSSPSGPNPSLDWLLLAGGRSRQLGSATQR